MKILKKLKLIRIIRFNLFLFFFINLTACDTGNNLASMGYNNQAKNLKRSNHVISNNTDLNKSAGYNVQLGLGYLEQGDINRAKAKFLKALKQAPKMPEVHYNIAYFYYTIHDYELAEMHYQQAIEHAYNRVPEALGMAYNNYGIFLCQTDRFKEADVQFKLAIADKNYIDTASAYENAGLCAIKAQNKKIALNYFEKANKINPLSAKSLIELGALNYEFRDYQKAKLYMSRYNQVALRNKRSLSIDLNIARALGDKKQEDEVVQLIESKYKNEFISHINTNDLDFEIKDYNFNIG